MERQINIIDLTHEIRADAPTWDGVSGFELSVTTDFKDCAPADLFKTQQIRCNGGIGTHVDAPAHAILGGRTVDQLTLAELSAECIVIDVSMEAHENPNYVILPRALEKYERAHGGIPAASFVLFYTGWDKYWSMPKKYHNNHNFPSMDITTAEALISRGVAGVGIDTLSLDTGANGFPVHHALLNADRYLVENVANARLLPLTGAHVLIMPMKIVGATEAPVRMLALI
ncbi:MAG: cyclase family protein [bacterium]|nr:cyclase family protein [bacterium]